MFNNFKFMKAGLNERLKHGDSKELHRNMDLMSHHVISDSEDEDSKMSSQDIKKENGVNGSYKTVTISDSDDGDSQNIPAKEHSLSASDKEESNEVTENGVLEASKIVTVLDSDEEISDSQSLSSHSMSNLSFIERSRRLGIPVKSYSRIKTFDSVKNNISTNKNNTTTKRMPSPIQSVKVKRKKKTGDSDCSSNDESEFKRSSAVVDSDMDSDEEISNTMNQSQKRVFEFLNDASDTELLLVPSCTQNKANTLLSFRPYKTWSQAVELFKETRVLGLSLLNSISNFLKTRHIVSNLMKKCLNIAIETEGIVSGGLTKLQSQPALLNPNMQLKSYQMVGLNWICIMHNQNLNVILADEMGLGKTIQVIAFLAYLNESGQTTNPHLIVAPSSTIENWAGEFSKWCPNLNVIIYHGSPDERRHMRVEWFREKFVGIDVIITTYNMISSSLEEKKMFKIMPLHYVVFDEAHMLKNMNTQRYVNLFNIKAQRRILLTGTPLQNSLIELMSLLNFVMPDMFHSKISYIKEFFSKKSKLPLEDLPKFEQEQVELAKRIMKPFILRRLKKDVLQDLPKKTSEVIKCPMTEDQRVRYFDMKSEAAVLAKSGSPDYNYMSTFMMLRKLANHPLTLRYIFQEKDLKKIAALLAEDIFYKENNKLHVFEDLCFMSDFDIHNLAQDNTSISHFKLKDDEFLKGGKFKKLDELLPKLKSDGHRIIIFSQFVFVLDLLEEYMRINNYKYLRLDGSVKSLERQELIDNYNDDSSIFIFLCTTRAGGIGINLTTADTVIIYDVDFNPYNDKQAEDRCHRLGQTKPVHIMRLISEGTVEEQIYEMAQNKLNLEQELTSEGTEDENEEKKNVEILLKEALGIKD